MPCVINCINVFTALKLANVETLVYTNHITSLYMSLCDLSDIVLMLYHGDCCWCYCPITWNKLNLCKDTSKLTIFFFGISHEVDLNNYSFLFVVMLFQTK